MATTASTPRSITWMLSAPVHQRVLLSNPGIADCFPVGVALLSLESCDAWHAERERSKNSELPLLDQRVCSFVRGSLPLKFGRSCSHWLLPSHNVADNADVRYSVTVNISRFHREARGSIPRTGVFLFGSRYPYSWFPRDARLFASIILDYRQGLKPEGLFPAP